MIIKFSDGNIDTKTVKGLIVAQVIKAGTGFFPGRMVLILRN
jgi:hypothetical protein